MSGLPEATAADPAPPAGAQVAGSGPGDAAADAAMRAERLLALLVIGLALAVLFAPALRSGVQFAARDAGRMYYPLKHLIAGEIAAGRLPSWNPYVAMGEPLVGGLVSGPLDPLNLLAVALPFDLGFKAMHLGCYLLAALGSLLWLRGRRLPPAAAAAGSLAFTLSGYLVGIANNFAYLRGLALMPLFLFALESAAASDRRRAPVRVGLAGLSWALVILGGEPQTWLLALPFGLVLLLLEPAGPGRRRTILLRAAGVLALGTAFASPVLLPALLELPRSDRAVFSTATQWWLAPGRWLELVVPGLSGPAAVEGARTARWVPSEYLGCVAFLLALAGALQRRRGRGAVAVALVALWLAAGPALGASQLGAHVPVWRSFQYPEKLCGWIAVAMAPLVALGVERVRGLAFFSKTRRRSAALGCGLAALVATDLLVANRLGPALMPADTVRAAASPLADWLRRHEPLARVSTPFELAEGEVADPEAVFRRWSRTLVPLFNVEARVGNLGWYGALAGARYRALREEGKAGFRYLQAAAAHGSGFVVVPGSLVNLERVGIPAQGVQIRAEDPSVPAWLVELPERRPFAYLAPRVERAASPEAALQAVLEPGFAGSPRTLVEGELPVPSGCREPAKLAATARCPRPDQCAIRTENPCAAALVVNLPPAPGWTFEVDGREVEPVPANYLASAIPVPAGEHLVTVRYRTPGLAEGGLLAVAGLAAVVLLSLRERRRHFAGAAA